MRRPPPALPLWAVATWLNARGYNQSFRTLRRLLETPHCPLKLRTWQPSRRHRTYPALAERDLPKLQELLGPPPRQPQMPLPLS